MATEKVRRQIASEAARLIFGRQEAEYHRAKQRAARQLGHGWVQPVDLPSNREVRAELQTWARSRENESDGQRLHDMRVAVLGLMRLLRAYRPRLVGDVLSGQLHDESIIECQLCSDNIAAILATLAAEPSIDQIESYRVTEHGFEIWGIRLRVGPDQIPVRIVVHDIQTARRLFKQGTPRQSLERAGISDVEAILRRDEANATAEQLLPANKSGAVDRFELYASLLLPREQVKQSPKWHPEGDALYHSLQVFELARQHIPYDEEFLTAALLHDVGKGIDRLEHVEAGLAALEGAITPRTAWLIEHQHEGHSLRDGTLGARSRRRLAAHPDYDELMLLVQCDREGRRRGAQVPDVEEALAYLRELAAACETESD